MIVWFHQFFRGYFFAVMGEKRVFVVVLSEIAGGVFAGKIVHHLYER